MKPYAFAHARKCYLKHPRMLWKGPEDSVVDLTAIFVQIWAIWVVSLEVTSNAIWRSRRKKRKQSARNIPFESVILLFVTESTYCRAFWKVKDIKNTLLCAFSSCGSYANRRWIPRGSPQPGFCSLGAQELLRSREHRISVWQTLRGCLEDSRTEEKINHLLLVLNWDWRAPPDVSRDNGCHIKLWHL